MRRSARPSGSFLRRHRLDGLVRRLIHAIFETEALSPLELGVMLAASPAAFISVEIEKWFLRRRASRVAGSQAGPRGSV